MTEPSVDAAKVPPGSWDPGGLPTEKTLSEAEDYEDAMRLMDRLPFASGLVFQYVQVAKEKAIQNDNYPYDIAVDDMHEAAIFMAEETIKNSGIDRKLDLTFSQREALHHVIAAGIEISLTCSLRWTEVRRAGRPD